MTLTYILSKDIYKHRRANKEDADVWLTKYSEEFQEEIDPIAHEKAIFRRTELYTIYR